MTCLYDNYFEEKNNNNKKKSKEIVPLPDYSF